MGDTIIYFCPRCEKKWSVDPGTGEWIVKEGVFDIKEQRHCPGCVTEIVEENESLANTILSACGVIMENDGHMEGAFLVDKVEELYRRLDKAYSLKEKLEESLVTSDQESWELQEYKESKELPYTQDVLDKVFGLINTVMKTLISLDDYEIDNGNEKVPKTGDEKH